MKNNHHHMNTNNKNENRHRGQSEQSKPKAFGSFPGLVASAAKEESLAEGQVKGGVQGLRSRAVLPSASPSNPPNKKNTATLPHPNKFCFKPCWAFPMIMILLGMLPPLVSDHARPYSNLRRLRCAKQFRWDVINVETLFHNLFAALLSAEPGPPLFFGGRMHENNCGLATQWAIAVHDATSKAAASPANPAESFGCQLACFAWSCRLCGKQQSPHPFCLFLFARTLTAFSPRETCQCLLLTTWVDGCC